MSSLNGTHVVKTNLAQSYRGHEIVENHDCPRLEETEHIKGGGEIEMIYLSYKYNLKILLTLVAEYQFSFAETLIYIINLTSCR